jgi:hypothetical protein
MLGEFELEKNGELKVMNFDLLKRSIEFHEVG